MYCPKCATQNGDDTKFCRSCGSNLSLVPQALTGRLPEARSRRRGRHDFERGGPASLANGITKVFVGLGFLLVSLALGLSNAGRGWWFWMLIPAFASLGKGVAEIVSAKYGSHLAPGANQTAMPAGARTGELPPPRNEVLFPPPSVTEQTTRQLDPTRDPYRHSD
ncbi:MAG: zinc ribbon domain-containing protein [Acidobacteriota bacterium]